MTYQHQLADWGEGGLRLTVTPDGMLAYEIPRTLPVEEVRLLLRANRDEILVFLRDLADIQVTALRTLDRLGRVPGMTAGDRVLVAAFRASVIEATARFDPLATTAGEWAIDYLAAERLPVPRDLLNCCSTSEVSR